MTSCPSDQQLRALLDEQLSRADEVRIVAHVEPCAACQERLNVLTRTGQPHVQALLDKRAGALTDIDPMPDDRALRCSSLEPTDFDLPQAPDPGADDFRDGRRLSIPDTEVTTYRIPGTPIAPILPLTEADPGDATDEDADWGSDRTAPGGPGAGLPSVKTNRSRRGPPVISGYEVLEKLGQGGMGVVYKARQRALNRLVALKLIIGGGEARADHLARFRIEAEALARIQHPNIMQIYDIGDEEGESFVSLELLEGGNLDDRLAGTPQPGQSGAELVATLARAVHAAHRVGIVHRDLKPANVLFSAEGVPKITDFGLAKRLESDSKQTETGQIMGSPSYMAPEQARGNNKDVGPAADIYALGAILYEVLTGRPPFKAETPLETLRQVADDEPVPPSRLVPRVPRDLETICLKCLHKERQKRYASAHDLALDLDCYRNGQPIKARRTPIWERGVKWSKRRPVAAMFAALGVAAFLGLTVGGAVYERRERFRLVRLDQHFVLEQTRALALSDQADRAARRDELEKVQGDLATFQPDVGRDPRLRQIAKRLDEKRMSVVERLRVLSSLEAARERDRAERDRFQKFLELRQEAQLYAAVTGTLLSADRLGKLRSSAHQALAIYAQDPNAALDAWALASPIPGALSEAEQTKVVEGCYDLLLILSQEASPARGSRLLDRAVRLRPQATAAYHLRRADCLERAGDLAGRDREIRAAQELTPATALDYFLSGRELAARGRFADAIRLLETAVQRDLDQTAAHLLLAVCYLNVQPRQLSAARTSLNVCIRSHPDLVGLYLLRASIFVEEASQAHGKQAADAFEAALADYRHALALRPDDDVRYALLGGRGLLHLRSNRPDLAADDLDSAIRLKPNQYQAHTTLGQVFLSQGRLDLAAAAFGRAIACQPAPSVLAQLYRTRALIYAPRGAITPAQRDLALGDLAEAIRLEPDQAKKASDHVWRARLYFGGGQTALALAACDAALALVPDEPEAHRVRISTLMKLKRYQEVLDSSDAYLARGKPSGEIFEIRGLARVARRDYSGAIADYGRALEMVPPIDPARRSRLLNLRGFAYEFADAPSLALADFEQSLRVAPDRSDALGGRGLAKICLGKWRSAVDDAEAAVRQSQAGTAGLTIDEARADQAQALYNAARIYALAVELAAQEFGRQGERTVALVRRYRSRAVDLLEQALERVSDREHREEILADPSLRLLRLRPVSPAPSQARSRQASLSPRRWDDR